MFECRPYKLLQLRLAYLIIYKQTTIALSQVCLELCRQYYNLLEYYKRILLSLKINIIPLLQALTVLIYKEVLY